MLPLPPREWGRASPGFAPGSAGLKHGGHGRAACAKKTPGKNPTSALSSSGARDVPLACMAWLAKPEPLPRKASKLRAGGRAAMNECARSKHGGRTGGKVWGLGKRPRSAPPVPNVARDATKCGLGSFDSSAALCDHTDLQFRSGAGVGAAGLRRLGRFVYNIHTHATKL